MLNGQNNYDFKIKKKLLKFSCAVMYHYSNFLMRRDSLRDGPPDKDYKTKRIKTY